MSIEQTAPILELDRLLDTLAVDAPGLSESEWGPTLGRLAALDDALAPRGDTLAHLRRRLLSETGGPAGRDEVAAERVAPVAATDVGASPAANPGRRVARRAYHAVAAAAILLVAVSSVWFGRGAERTPPAGAPSVAQVGSNLPSAGTAPPGPTGAVSPGRAGVDAVDVARASLGGFGSADLVGLLAIGANAERRDLVAAHDQMLREMDASWTALVEGRGWEAVVGAAQDEVAPTEPPPPLSAA